MSTGSIAIRAIGFAEHLLPSKTKPTAAELVEVDSAEHEVAREVTREAKRPKTVGYYCPEWWESHHYERR